VLVNLPPPKAQLFRLPEWRVGEQRPVTIPYGVEVFADVFNVTGQFRPTSNALQVTLHRTSPQLKRFPVFAL
jgi:hypothetical protein